jgi:hypothetical protein
MAQSERVSDVAVAEMERNVGNRVPTSRRATNRSRLVLYERQNRKRFAVATHVESGRNVFDAVTGTVGGNPQFIDCGCKLKDTFSHRDAAAGAVDGVGASGDASVLAFRRASIVTRLFEALTQTD